MSLIERTASSTRLFDENTGGELLLRLAQRDPLPQWQEPKLL
jgi:hypothetical protein